MGPRVVGAETVYAAAAAWVDRGLRTGDSLFTPGRPIWTTELLDELQRRFLDRPDESEDPFWTKLERQLAGSEPEVHQLMAEILYVYFIVDRRKDSTTVQAQLSEVLGWSGEASAIPPEMVAGLTPGLGRGGQGFHINRPFNVGFIIEFASQWKEQEPVDRQRLLDDPWAFKAFVMGLHLQSAMLEDSQEAPAMQRQALLHLVHPDTFEFIMSLNQKNKIARAYESLLEIPDEDIDRNLQRIRSALEGQHGQGFKFYDKPIRVQWDRSYARDKWVQLIASTQKYMESGDLEALENTYKIEIGQRLAAARATVLTKSEEWPDLIKHSIRNSGNLIHHVQKAQFCDWIDEAPDDAHRALSMLWSDGDTDSCERVRAFMDLFSGSVISGVGTRTNIASVLLMGLDAEQYPPFRDDPVRAGVRAHRIRAAEPRRRRGGNLRPRARVLWTNSSSRRRSTIWNCAALTPSRRSSCSSTTKRRDPKASHQAMRRSELSRQASRSLPRNYAFRWRSLRTSSGCSTTSGR